jgi:putative aminophosphonate oxidoreductase
MSGLSATAAAGSERSWWLREALADERPAPQLTGERTAEVCIVGGGFSGLWTALRIKELEPSRDVAIVEADVCGGGASGRNGGFAMTFWHHFRALERVCGSVEALALARASTAAVQEIGVFCRDHGIEAQFRPDGWLWTATNGAQIGAWASTLTAIERHGEHPFESIAPAEVAARAGSDRHLAGVFEAGSATVQPALLTRGLRRVALERGVRIFEGSPMVGLGRGSVLEVRTAAGVVRARRVVIAMNAWSGRLPELRRSFVTVGSDVVITDPAPERLHAIGLRDGISISDSRLMVHYYRPTGDGRMAFGKGGGKLAFDSRIGRGFNGASPRAASVASAMRALYPPLADVPVAASWTGPIDRTVDGLPFFTSLGRPDLVCGLGFSGNGVGPSVLGGKILASMVLDRDDEWSRCGLVRAVPGGLPPEPLRYLGGRIVQAAVARKEHAEDREQQPSWVDRRVAGLAPAGLVPVD